ncbi:MAG TPA: 3'(2'),5'-bisphosphate nucleotidase [Candidatus Hydrogenedentes bacterium]|nr:3'(2'),5'-bisphosphate nucleotidase [Candidatus Hydrogenedentota bacterium]
MWDTRLPEIRMAVDAVRTTAVLAREVHSAALGQMTKGDLSPVTVADFAAQAVVAHMLGQAFPQDALVAEERSAALQTAEGAPTLAEVLRFVRDIEPGATEEDVCAWIDRGAADPGERFWVLDPVDGTKGYLRGGHYAVAFALIESGQVKLGVLGCPNLGLSCDPDGRGYGVLVVAQRGEGAWAMPLDGDADAARLEVSDRGDPVEARVLRSFETGHTNTDQIESLVSLMGVRAAPVLMDSQAKYAVMAAGHGDVLFRLLSPKQPDYREKLWDQAAGSIVIEEAGGRISDLYGTPLDFSQGRRLEANRGVLATNGRLHDAALDALAQVLDGA